MDNAVFNQQLFDFLKNSPTPYHAVEQMAQRLEAAGFERLDEQAEWSLASGQRYYVTRNDSTIIAFQTGHGDPVKQGVRMIGAHTDSPCLRVKPNPELFRKGYYQLGVEVYGGALLSPWFDRDLSLAGRVSYVDGKGRLRDGLINFSRPVATVPSLAIHLDREANNSRTVNPQTDIPPLLMQAPEKDAVPFKELLAHQLREEHPQADVAKVLDYELSFYDTQPPSTVGLNGEFIASARLDNLLSCFIGLQALLDADSAQPAVLVCNDHEEVGSMSAEGAQGPFLSSLLDRWVGAAQRPRVIARSMMVSADNAHGVHPNYADRHDGNHGPLLNAGPVIKVNNNQRYATNSRTAALYRHLSETLDLPCQTFVVRTDMGCGSTIGPLTAGNLGVRTLDIGVPQFAMHSIREMAGAKDGYTLYQVLRRYIELESLD
ncbi:M18 family aminopeptidase [Marinobacter nanhaiticus D15-8W]|uniref:M18 family aminopeptidase n=1 Tax=Marinobacter nanhaiticus D15-8W TaxID=626887 RepID=N6W2Q8_9GAMM|nr:M18 family aminopeptidase [Marinobacter nanhaiticus]ENO14399.1 M18 family aminopeptidase [Marinobacter nanhaiticus D15-8W]BES71789.1 M18 family aminopeptidase [Marinobacter nanhaiticus D15-8W]